MPFATLPDTHKSRWTDELTAEKMKECVWIAKLNRPELKTLKFRTDFCVIAEGLHQQRFKFLWDILVDRLWIPQIPSVTNAIEISDMRKGTGGWVKKATGK
jgi:hypothetical protein